MSIKTIALLTADIHLSHNPPVARSGEDWYEAMKRPLMELGRLKDDYKVPILCAGDVFDKWNVCPELISFALEYLPDMYSIPGQHDLPNHSMEEIKRSAYWVLLYAKKITGLFGGLVKKDFKNPWDLYGFPWGTDIKGYSSDQLSIALIHKFIYSSKKNSYQGAPKEEKISGYASCLQGFDVAIFGDNHKHFSGYVSDCTIWNCGTLIPRKIDEQNYKPVVGLLQDDGSIISHYMDTSKDVWVDARPEKTAEQIDMSEFLAELRESCDDDFDFFEAVERYLKDHEISEDVEKEVLEVLDEVK